MPILTTDLELRLSGGASNADANASIGGAKSTTVIATGVANNVFDDVSGAESTAGDVEYRCIYLHNDHATLAAQNPRVWINTQTPSPTTDVAIGLGSAGVNGTETATADESTAPGGVTFSQPATEGAALTFADVPAGQHMPVWIRRTVNAGSAASADSGILEWRVDTAA